MDSVQNSIGVRPCDTRTKPHRRLPTVCGEGLIAESTPPDTIDGLRGPRVAGGPLRFCKRSETDDCCAEHTNKRYGFARGHNAPDAMPIPDRRPLSCTFKGHLRRISAS